MQEVWHIDVESRSAVDLIKVGAHYYARHESTEVTLFALSIGREDPVAFDLLSGDQLPDWLVSGLEDPNILKLAFNAPFEIQVITHAMGIPTPPEQWMDVAVLARSLSVPGKLAQVGERLGLPAEDLKQAHGTALISYFCKPMTPPPKGGGYRFRDPRADLDRWNQFKEYNLQDVVAERAIFDAIKPYLRYTYNREQHELWLLDYKINDAGLPVDTDYVDAALELDEGYRAQLINRSKLVTGLDNPNSVPQLMAWLNSEGFAAPDLTKDTVARLLVRPDLPSGVRTVLELRQQLSKTSVKKFKVFSAQTDPCDGRLRGAFSYMGAARTGRWAGGGVQPHNLPGATVGGVDEVDEIQAQIGRIRTLVLRGDYATMDMLYPSVYEALTSTVRSAIAAPADKMLCVADLSSIETVIIGWLSGCARILDLFRTGKDAYKDYATEVFRIPYEQVSKAQRKFAKPPVLGCGFGLGAFGLVAYAEGFGVDLSELFTSDDIDLIPETEGGGRYQHASDVPKALKAVAAAQKLVNVYRGSYPEVPRWWGQLKQAAFHAVEQRGSASAGSVSYTYEHPYLFCRLPSGRHLAYLNPTVGWVEHPQFGRVKTLSYDGLDQTTRQWVRVHTHKGKLAENIVQAVARDILGYGLRNADAEGFEIVGHVHDESITLVDYVSQPERRQQKLDKLIECMTDLPPWAAGAPVGAAGWVGKFYMKD